MEFCSLDSMQCPHDHSDLDFRQKEEVVGHVCKGCSGIFLTAIGVDRFKVIHQTDVLQLIDRQQLSPSSKINCPNCSTKMSLVLIDDIEIDVCTHCTGIWFDKAEVAKIIEMYGDKPRYEGNGWYVFLEVLSWFSGGGRC